ncbi:methyltransferase domain-containing protein [Kitasatospora purpeofusca]|uniref:methyltransferase domain-containing protein n=1 Tax=Kitasatospora purpeofusca TaxID=67352 RepID=UPI002A5ABD62|nr:methyltransferase domain-containing protein [Kitasatospora purpeofusca]MDY0810335.1 methyltransferase [Kitasatospora purpeofusca]
MTGEHETGQAAMRGLLRAVAEYLGHDVAPEWEAAAYAVPRHHFMPELVRDANTLEPISRTGDPAGWWATAYAEAPVVTQVNDGRETDDDPVPTSSLSDPGIVFRMLDMLDLRSGMRVLEIGTGPGWNAALMSHRLGPDLVTSVEVDPAVAASARTALHDLGLSPVVVCGDGSRGWAPGAPYDRVIATCAFRSVPSDLIAQTVPGGLVLLPWDSPWMGWGLLLLAVAEDGSASGRFSPHSAFMLNRRQRSGVRLYRDVVRDEHVPDESFTDLPAFEIAEDRGDLSFSIGIRLADVWQAWDNDPDVDGVARRLWLATTDAKSWAAVDWAGDGAKGFTVWQHGPRRLWAEVAEAHAWWLVEDEPGPDRFGLTVAPDGSHSYWLDDPRTVVRSSAPPLE